MRNLYREHILDHYRHPRNEGTLEGADISCELDNPVCGDVVRLDVRLKDGRKVFEVTWSPEAGKVSRTTVSIDRYGFRLARELAMLMRALMEFEHYGGTLVSRPGMFSTLRSNLVREEGGGAVSL